MKRKAAKPRQRDAVPAKKPAAAAAILPMEVQVGDRFTDHGFEWEVLTRPTAMHGAKNLRARIVRPGLPDTERDMIWAAHERVEIRRAHRSKQ